MRVSYMYATYDADSINILPKTKAWHVSVHLSLNSPSNELQYSPEHTPLDQFRDFLSVEFVSDSATFLTAVGGSPVF